MTFFTIKNIGLLLLLGVLVFPVGINQSYAQQNNQAFVDPPNTAPIADDFNIQILPNSAATIPFDEIISDTESLFSALDITFSFVDTDLAANQVSVTSGATAAAGDATFTVTADDVVITESGSGGASVPRAIELTYTVTDTGSLSDTGTINIFVVESITSTFDGDLDHRIFDVSLESLPDYTTTFDGAEYRGLLNVVDIFGLDENQLLNIIVTIESEGSEGGTATFTHNASFSSFLATLTYTPAEGFSGPETFTYTGTEGGTTASGTFTFIVEAAPPTTNTAPTTTAITVTAVQGVAGEIDFSGIDDDSDTFAELNIEFDLTNSAGGNPEDNLSTQVVFNTADVDSSNTDDSILLVTSETLRFTVDAEATSGIYNLEYIVTDSGGLATTGHVIFTIAESTTNTAPTADNFNIQIRPGTTATIPFDDIISDIESLFSALEITFLFVDTDLAANQVSVTSGATATAGDATFDVTAVDVVITESGSGGASVPRTIELTYTVSDGLLESTGTINIFVVAALTSTFDGDLDDRTFTVPAGSSEHVETFSITDFTNLVNIVDTFGLTEADRNDIILSIADGSNEGTATFTSDGSSSTSFTILTYTPAEGFSGTETFLYTGSANGVIASGTFTFIVAAAPPPTNQPPTTSPIVVTAAPGVAGVIDFSEIDDDSDSFGELDIVFDLTNSAGGNPEISISTGVVFDTNDASLTAGSTQLSIINPMLRFTVNDAATLGIYNLAYTVTDTDGGTSTGAVTFTIEAVTCETSLAAGVQFGTLRVGATSGVSSPISIVNEGNVPVQSLIQGADWISTADAGVVTMNAGQTKYSVNQGDEYGDRTSLSGMPVNVGDDIAVSESLEVYLQLFAQLIVDTFRGPTTQTMTVTSDCS